MAIPFVGVSGRNCEHSPDRCIGSPCKNGGVCTDLGSRLECACPKGRSGDGERLISNFAVSAPAFAGSDRLDFWAHLDIFIVFGDHASAIWTVSITSHIFLPSKSLKSYFRLPIPRCFLHRGYVPERRRVRGRRVQVQRWWVAFIFSYYFRNWFGDAICFIIHINVCAIKLF